LEQGTPGQARPRQEGEDDLAGLPDQGLARGAFRGQLILVKIYRGVSLECRKNGQLRTTMLRLHAAD
jgi:hypothetical protein